MDWDRCMVFAKKELCATYGLYRENGKENGNCYIIWDYIPVQSKRIMNLMREGFFIISRGGRLAD